MSESLSPRRHPLAWLFAIAVLALAILPAFTQETSSISDKVRTTFTGYVFNRASGTFDTRATITNASTQTLQAPLSLVITSISSPSVTLANSAGTTQAGNAYVLVPIPVAGLAPSMAVNNVTLRFKNTNPSVPFTFTHLVVGTLPPIADAGANLSGLVGKPIALDGSASRDPQGKLLTYAWRIVQRPAGSKASLVRPNTPNPQITPDLAGTFQFELEVNNGTLTSTPAGVTLTASLTNAAPVSRPGSPQNGRAGAPVVLDGSLSSDAEGAPLIALWSFASKPATSALTDTAIATRNALKASFVPDVAGKYTLKLTVSDGSLSNSANVEINVVAPNVPPNPNAGTDVLLNLGGTAQLDATASSDSDQGPAPLSYSWSIASKPSASVLTDSSLIGTTTAQVSFVPDKAGSYQLKLILTDGEAFAEDTVLVVVNTPPNPQDDSVTTKAAIALDVEVLGNDSDADGDVLTVSAVSAPINGSTSINSIGSVKYTPRTNFVGTDSFTYTVSDGRGGTKSAKVNVTVASSTSNAAPSVSARAEARIIQSERLVLRGSISDDGLPYPPGRLTTLWSKVSGPGNVSFASASSPATSAGFSAPGNYVLRLSASDGVLSGSAEVAVIVTMPFAPPIPSGTIADLSASSKFLYSGPNALQKGVTPNAIESVRAAVLRGRVTLRNGTPLAGVRITVLNHTEFGHTVTRADGFFDMAVNGGGLLTVTYEKAGYYKVQRQADAHARDYTVIDDVVMIPPDATVSVVDLAQPGMQVARGSVVTDKDGSRQLTFLFPSDVTAQMVMADGSRRPINKMSIRVTEFTVGEAGLRAMPAELPPESAYTYAFVTTADEALAAGAKDVVFSRPIPAYVDNFTNFPVGIPVPFGIYNADKGMWEADRSGVVLKILSISGGTAILDTDDDGVADNGVALGVSEEERRRLATMYVAGKTLWRVLVPHFDSPCDANWGWFEPPDSEDPRQLLAEIEQQEEEGCETSGSIIECHNQVLRETLAIPGTPFGLHYTSARVRGHQKDYRLRVPLSGARLPPSLKGIRLEVHVAGTVFKRSFPAAPNQSYEFVWDGRDVYGRAVAGQQPALVRVGYEYEAVYQPVPMFRSNVTYDRGATLPSGWPAIGIARQLAIRWQAYRTPLGAFTPEHAGLGNWTLSVHHAYDPAGKTLYFGSALRRSASAQTFDIVESVAGAQIRRDDGTAIPPFTSRPEANDLPANSVSLGIADGLALGPDGSVYLATRTGSGPFIRRIRPDGVITLVAGNTAANTLCRSGGPCGDGGPALLAGFSDPIVTDVGPDSSVYIVERGRNTVRKISTDGRIVTVAGRYQTCAPSGGIACSAGDGGPATSADLSFVKDVKLAPDGTLFIALGASIRKVDPSGTISYVAGVRPTSRFVRVGEEGGSPVDIIMRPFRIALGPDGSLYYFDGQTFRQRIRRITPDGLVRSITGTQINPLPGYSGDDGPAELVQVSNIAGLAVAKNGSVYFSQPTGGTGGQSAIRVIQPNGIVAAVTSSRMIPRTVVSPAAGRATGNGGPAGNALAFPSYLTLSQDGALYFINALHSGVPSMVRRIRPALPGFNPGDLNFASEDGAELYVFDGITGQHRRTLNALTGTTRYQFTYDSTKRLEGVIDAYGNKTTIERDGFGNPTSIVGPFGHRTRIALDANGLLQGVTNPAGEAVTLNNQIDGLLLSMTDAKGQTHRYSYDPLGLLIRDENPAGGVKTLTRTDTASGRTIVLKTALNRTTIYQVEQLPGNVKKLTTIGPAGERTDHVFDKDGTKTTSYPDGTVDVVAQSGDPRWGMQAPVASLTRKLPSGLTFVSTAVRNIEFENTSNPFAIKALTDIATINGRVWKTTYDGQTRTFTSQSPEGRQQFTTLDTQQRVVTSQVNGLHPTTYEYETRGRLQRITQGVSPDTRVSTMTYGADGFLASAEDPLKQVVRFSYDAAGRPISQTRPDGQVIRLAYDRNSNVTEVTPPGKPVHRFNFDPADLTSRYLPPALGALPVSTDYTYNLDQQLQREARPDGKAIDVGYDAAGRVQQLTMPHGVQRFTYQPNTGQLASIVAPGGVTNTHLYDGPLLKETSWSGTIAGRVSREYDNNFRITADAVNGANSVSYAYDNDDLVKQAGALTINRDRVTGLVTNTTIGIVSDEWSNDKFAELIKYTAKAGPTALYEVSYKRDRLGRIDTKTETVQGVTSIYKYTYDLVGRLTAVHRNAAVVESYTYDDNGNRLSALGVSSASYDAQDRLLGYGGGSYTHTANGEIKTKTSAGLTTTYDYDVFGNLRHVTLSSGAKIEYIVDGEQRRIGKKVNGSLVQGFVYHGGHRPVAELDGSGALVSRFVYRSGSNVPALMIKGGATYLFLTDHVGSPRLVINTSTGTIAQQVEYDSFGIRANNTNSGFQPFGFGAGMSDTETGFVRFGVRDYDAFSGRWTSKDPLRYRAGSTNLYDYGGSDPTNRIDPTGLSYLIYEDESETLTLYDSNGNRIEAWRAANNVGANTNGPWPTDLETTHRFSHYNRHPEAANPDSAYGSNGIFVFHYEGRDGMGVHSGRNNLGGHTYRTLGCIRTTDAATARIRAVHEGGCSNTLGMCIPADPVTAIVVRSRKTRAPVVGGGQ